MSFLDQISMKGKTVLITGGRDMYGRGVTDALSDLGADLYLGSHSIDSARPFVEELKTTKGIKAEAVAFDQFDIESCEKMVQHVIEKEGKIDCFVLCSRILPKGPGVGWFQGEEQLSENVHINSGSSMYLLSLVMKQMVKQGFGSIVVFGSMMGLIGVEVNNYEGNPGMAGGAYGHAYAVDKSGLTAWVRHAASYLGQYGVRINAVCPGGLESPRTNPVFAEVFSKHTQVGRLAKQTDIGGPVIMLLSDAGAYLTGLSIPVDGGYTCL